MIGDSDLKTIGFSLPLECSWLKGGYNTTQCDTIYDEMQFSSIKKLAYKSNSNDEKSFSRSQKEFLHHYLCTSIKPSYVKRKES